MQSLCIFSPRSGWKHKAWGGAKRNPRLTTDQKTERAKRATALTPQFCLDKRLSPTSRALPGVPTILGFRFAPPQALCFHPLRGFLKGELAQTCSEVPEVCRTSLTLDRRLAEDHQAVPDEHWPIAGFLPRAPRCSCLPVRW